MPTPVKLPMARVLSLLLAFALMFSAAGCARLKPEEAGRRRAEAIAARVVKQAGGRRALSRIHYLRFDYVVQENGREVLRRSHWWDLETGRYRLETKHEGRPWIALFNVKTRDGQVFEGYRPEPVKDNATALQEALALHNGDAFWPLGVLRLRDPGTNLDDIGEQTVAGKSFSTITLWFDPQADPATHAGLHDRYWFYIDETNWRPYVWSFIETPGGPQVTYLWSRFQPVGPLTLPIRFEQVGARRVVTIDSLFAPAEMRDEIFMNP